MSDAVSIFDGIEQSTSEDEEQGSSDDDPLESADLGDDPGREDEDKDLNEDKGEQVNPSFHRGKVVHRLEVCRGVCQPLCFSTHDVGDLLLFGRDLLSDR